jgi:hypothetical protein
MTSAARRHIDSCPRPSSVACGLDPILFPCYPSPPPLSPLPFPVTLPLLSLSPLSLLLYPLSLSPVTFPSYHFPSIPLPIIIIIPTYLHFPFIPPPYLLNIVGWGFWQDKGSRLLITARRSYTNINRHIHTCHSTLTLTHAESMRIPQTIPQIGLPDFIRHQ